MIITYHGLQFFKIQHGGIVLAFNPPSKSSDYTSRSFGADMVLQSINHEDFNGGKLLSNGTKEPFIVRRSGEYEVQDVFIKGYQTQAHYGGGEEKINTIYIVELEGIRICFLGALESIELEPKIFEALDDIDILFVPIGDDGVIGPSDAYKLAVKLEASIIIPMHYKNEKAEVLSSFLKEAGGESKKSQDKLTIKKKDIQKEVGNVVVLKTT